MTKLSGEIGLARRGGFLTYGEDLLDKLRRRRVYLLLLASDSSARAQKDIAQANVLPCPVVALTYTKLELGGLISVGPVNALGVQNQGLAHKMLDTIRKEGESDVKIQKQEES